jgi:RsiW-degrading membrane proteinase PrsW (M82 family)
MVKGAQMLVALLDDTSEHIICALVMTFVTVPVVIAFLHERGKPGVKIPATICLWSSIVGTGLAWVAYVISEHEEEPTFVPVKVVFVGGLLVLSPICLCGKWFADWVVRTLRLKPRAQRVLFSILGVEVRPANIFAWMILIVYIWGVIEMWRFSS